MTLNVLVPKRRNQKNLAVTENEFRNPFYALERQMDRLFHDFFGEEYGLVPRTGKAREMAFIPAVDLVNAEKEITVTAELPGMEQKDIDVSLEENVLTISGEKKFEKEEKEQHYYYKESRNGSFSRSINLPAEIDEEHIEANFKNGILEIRLPKTEPEKPQTKKISIKNG